MWKSVACWNYRLSSWADPSAVLLLLSAGNTTTLFKSSNLMTLIITQKTMISKQASVGVRNLCAMCFLVIKAFCTKAPLTSHLRTFTQVRNDDNAYFSIEIESLKNTSHNGSRHHLYSFSKLSNRTHMIVGYRRQWMKTKAVRRIIINFHHSKKSLTSFCNCSCSRCCLRYY